MLKDGLIAERGTHGALIAKDGLYASMWSRQREATEAEEHLEQARALEKNLDSTGRTPGGSGV